MGFHVLKNGETVVAHAKRSGLSWQRVWRDAHNAGLRARCNDDPDQVGAGDELFVPAVEGKWLEVVAGQSHRFVARPATEALCIELTGPDGLPLAGGRWELEIDHVIHSGSCPTPIAIDGPFTSPVAILRVFDARGRISTEWELLLGMLPMNKGDEHLALGLQARLQNLGFDPGPLDGRIGRRTQAAIRAFQQTHGLAPTGRLQDVREQLRAVHGS